MFLVNGEYLGLVESYEMVKVCKALAAAPLGCSECLEVFGILGVTSVKSLVSHPEFRVVLNGVSAMNSFTEPLQV
jgi:hypothetical protein